MSSTVIDPESLAARLSDLKSIDDPHTGKALPSAVGQRSPLWPLAPHWARIELRQVTEQGARRLEEYAFRPVPDAAHLPIFPGADLPVAFMIERQASDAVARLYSAHQFVADRGPLLPVDAQLVPHRGPQDILARYFPTLHAAALEPTLALFETDGYLQHSNGETFRGRERLRIDFTKFFQSGGIKLRYCNKTDQGAITALECFMPSGRPAVAVYERGRTGLVGAVRLYL